jgi:hypothetical protein
MGSQMSLMPLKIEQAERRNSTSKPATQLIYDLWSLGYPSLLGVLFVAIGLARVITSSKGERERTSGVLMMVMMSCYRRINQRLEQRSAIKHHHIIFFLIKGESPSCELGGSSVCLFVCWMITFHF